MELKRKNDYNPKHLIIKNKKELFSDLLKITANSTLLRICQIVE
jgi:hypothetical protein